MIDMIFLAAMNVRARAADRMKGIELISMLLGLVALVIVAIVLLKFGGDIAGNALKSASQFFSGVIDSILGLFSFGNFQGGRVPAPN